MPILALLPILSICKIPYLVETGIFYKGPVCEGLFKGLRFI